MKNLLYLLTLFLFACGSSDDSSEAESNFSIELTPSDGNEVAIDQIFSIEVNANEDLKYIWPSFDNFTSSGYGSSSGTPHTLYYALDDLGEKTISVRAKNEKEEVSEKQIVVNVVRGQAIKITGLQLISFQNIHGTFDPEYAETDPNRLADLAFAFSKHQIGNGMTPDYGIRLWYRSAILENQGNLTWDISPENLYMKPDQHLYFSLGEVDGELEAANLLGGSVPYKELSFAAYLATKPSSISYSFPEIGLEFTLFIEWPN